jgi:hypothetical protein
VSEWVRELGGGRVQAVQQAFPRPFVLHGLIMASRTVSIPCSTRVSSHGPALWLLWNSVDVLIRVMACDEALRACLGGGWVHAPQQSPPRLAVLVAARNVKTPGST